MNRYNNNFIENYGVEYSWQDFLQIQPPVDYCVVVLF